MQAYISCSFLRSELLNFCIKSINSAIFWSTWWGSAANTRWKKSLAALSISSELWAGPIWLGNNSPSFDITSLMYNWVSGLILVFAWFLRSLKFSKVIQSFSLLRWDLSSTWDLKISSYSPMISGERFVCSTIGEIICSLMYFKRALMNGVPTSEMRRPSHTS